MGTRIGRARHDFALCSQSPDVREPSTLVDCQQPGCIGAGVWLLSRRLPRRPVALCTRDTARRLRRRELYSRPRAQFRRVLRQAGYVLVERFANTARLDIWPDSSAGEVAVDVRHIEVGARAYMAGEFYRDADRFVR